MPVHLTTITISVTKIFCFIIRLTNIYQTYWYPYSKDLDKCMCYDKLVLKYLHVVFMPSTLDGSMLVLAADYSF